MCAVAETDKQSIVRVFGNLQRDKTVDLTSSPGCALRSEIPVSLAIDGLIKRYSRDLAIGPISFSVREGEFFSLLGPSGCGKTTTLRCVAGFEKPDDGTISVNGARVEATPAHKRNIGLVFQSHALFPHLTIEENIAFGLVVKKVSRDEMARRVAAIVEKVGLAGLEKRMPHQISGGQQQRVALARSLVLEPPLLLLDEPLSSLDLKLRVQMREELKKLQRRIQKTTVFVTHDQTEALALSDRIAVLSNGRIEQIGSPREIYEAPVSRFVASFIGNSNLLDVEIVDKKKGYLEISTQHGLKLVTKVQASPPARRLTALIRPEHIQLDVAAGEDLLTWNQFTVHITDHVYLGEHVEVHVLPPGGDPLVAAARPSASLDLILHARRAFARLNPEHITILGR
jgi:ABC-type Fe3+/spermidine/putrescine transport system ATPase subunit